MRTLMLLTVILLSGCTPDVADETGDPDDTGQRPQDVTIWSGPIFTFTKLDDADPTDPANQDAITEHVILTRGEKGALFNVVVESAANTGSPLGTEWAQGTTEELGDLVFDTLKGAANNKMESVPGKPFVLHLVEDDVYLDLTFSSWTSGGSGGGFSYERTTAE